MRIRICVLLALATVATCALIRDEDSEPGLLIGLKAQHKYGKPTLESVLRHVNSINGKQGSITLQDISDFVYYAPMTIGTPEQTFNMVFDLTYGDMFIPNKQYCKINPGYCKTHPTYDSSKSSTYKVNNKTISSAYRDRDFTGYLSQDRIDIAGLSVSNQVFAEVTEMRDPPGVNSKFEERVDGVIGLGLKGLSQFGVNTPFLNMIKEKVVKKPVFSFYLNKTAGGDAELTLGGVDKKRFKGPWTWAPLTNKTIWEVKVDGISFKGKSLATDLTAAPFIGFSYILGPKDAFTTINEAIGGSYLYGVYTVDCNSIPKLPPVTFVINKRNFVLKGEDYIAKMSLGAKEVVCFSALMGLIDDGTPSLLLGDAFMHRFYTQFDLGKERVGFANAK